MVAAIARPTARPIRRTGSATMIQTATATHAATVLLTIADHGWAKGLFGTAKSKTEVAPKGNKIAT